MSSLYREKILEHYKEPHNFGELDDADVTVEVSNPHCGDEFTFQACIEEGTVEDIRFEGGGCALSTASCSVLTDEMQGGDVESLKNISEEQLFTLLGLERDAVTPMRMKCVLLGRDGAQQLADEV